MTSVLYLGHDNEADLELLEDGVNLSQERYDAITKVTLRLEPFGQGVAITLDSDVTPGLFLWGGADPGRKLRFEGGKLADAGAVAGSYYGRLVVFAPDQPTGIVWVDADTYGVYIRA